MPPGRPRAPNNLSQIQTFTKVLHSSNGRPIIVFASAFHTFQFFTQLFLRPRSRSHGRTSIGCCSIPAATATLEDRSSRVQQRIPSQSSTPLGIGEKSASKHFEADPWN
ncbi:hypothetical protein R1flu_003468 [Riccia fluitans]|uniref:Uncharacterized protein n=1 Tax=Riccia fluitans TaxID=41844 RepID=A0ABD1Y931_9MARC